MTKSLKNVKNVKCKLKDLEYGEKTENHGAILRHGSISTRTDVAENTEYASQPFFQTATQFLETADFRPQDEKYPVVSTSIQQMVESVVSGKSPEDAIKQYTIDVTRIVGEENIAQ